MANDRKQVKRKPLESKKASIRSASAADKPVYPRPFTEQVRERKPGTKTRDEIKKTSIRGKAH
jgi:hypothetical protein